MKSGLFDVKKSESNVIKLQSSIVQDDITERVSNAFDYTFDGKIETEIAIPNFPKELSAHFSAHY